MLDEARAASALDRPNVGTIFEVGEDETGRAFIAMACYEGGTLRDRLRRGALSPAEAARVGLQVAEGLRAAHARGIVHRDIKPENLVFDDEGRVRIVDFGLAGAPRESRDASTEVIRGTPAYMSRCAASRRIRATTSGRWGWSSTRCSRGAVPHRGRPPGPLPRPVPRSRIRSPSSWTGASSPTRATGPPTPARSPTSSGGSRRWRTSAIAGIAGVALLTGVVWLTGARNDGDGAVGDLGRVVVAEFEAAEDGADLARAAREALVVDLQQSGFVSVLGWPEVTRVFERMGLPPETRLDPGQALEVAERAGAGAVVGATVIARGPAVSRERARGRDGVGTRALRGADHCRFRGASRCRGAPLPRDPRASRRGSRDATQDPASSPSLDRVPRGAPALRRGRTRGDPGQ